MLLLLLLLFTEIKTKSDAKSFLFTKWPASSKERRDKQIVVVGHEEIEIDTVCSLTALYLFFPRGIRQVYRGFWIGFVEYYFVLQIY